MLKARDHTRSFCHCDFSTAVVAHVHHDPDGQAVTWYPKDVAATAIVNPPRRFQRVAAEHLAKNR